jgi:hypothetical protein
MRGSTRGRLTALAAIALALAAGGCSRERTLTASEFVTKINDQGVEMRLGDRLVSDDESEKIYAIELEPVTGLPDKAAGNQHSGGSLSVHDDGAAAEERLSACRASADLLCYRAANIVIVLEGGGLQTQRLGAAIRNLAEDDSG